MRPKVDLEFPIDAILFHLHAELASGKDGHYTADLLSAALGLPRNIVSVAIAHMKERGLVWSKAQEFESYDYDDAGLHFLHESARDPAKRTGSRKYIQEHVYISIDGIETVQSWDDPHYDKVSKRTAAVLQGNVGAPAADRTVALDHNGPKVAAAIDALDQFLDAAQKNNEFGELFAAPEDRIRFVSEVKLGQRLLSESRLRWATTKALLVDNLKFVMSKMADATLGALAKKAVEAIIALFA